MSAARPFSWWLGYSLAHAGDVIDGENVPRSWEQRNALNAGVNAARHPYVCALDADAPGLQDVVTNFNIVKARTAAWVNAQTLWVLQQQAPTLEVPKLSPEQARLARERVALRQQAQKQWKGGERAAAIAAIGTVSLATTPAFAGKGGGKGGGFHHHHHIRGGIGLGLVAYDSCYRNVWALNRFGETVLRRVWVCG